MQSLKTTFLIVVTNFRCLSQFSNTICASAAKVQKSLRESLFSNLFCDRVSLSFSHLAVIKDFTCHFNSNVPQCLHFAMYESQCLYCSTISAKSCHISKIFSPYILCIILYLFISGARILNLLFDTVYH